MRQLPALGRRGEGWVVGQVVLFAGIAVAPFAGGERWPAGAGAPAAAVGAVLLAGGLALSVAAGLRLGPSLTPFPAPRRGSRLASGGVYALARHPIYGGVLLVAAGWTILLPSYPGAALTAVLAVFFDLKSRREEAWLRERVDGYDAYRARVRRRLLPFVY